MNEPRFTVKLRKIEYLDKGDNVGRDFEIVIKTAEKLLVAGGNENTVRFQAKIAFGKTKKYDPPLPLFERKISAFGGPYRLSINVEVREREAKRKNDDYGKNEFQGAFSRKLLRSGDTLEVTVSGVAGDKKDGAAKKARLKFYFEFGTEVPLEIPEELPLSFVPEGIPPGGYPLIAVMSDHHMGAGDVGDDFTAIDEVAFVQAINWLLSTAKKYGKPVELILLGDFFEFWETRPFFKPDTAFDEVLKNAKSKVDRVMGAHGRVIAALLAFQKAGHKVIYLPGNHDGEIDNAQVQKYIKQQTEIPFEFRPAYGNKDFSLFATHGHRFDKPFNFPTSITVAPPGRYVTERILGLIEAYGAKYNLIFDEDPIPIKGPFNDVDAVQDYVSYISCLRSKGLIPKDLAKTVRAEIDKLLKLKFGFAKRLGANLAKQFGADPDPLDEIRFFLELAQKSSSGPDAGGDDARTLLQPQYKCIVMGHTHKALFVDLGGGNLYVNSGNWQDAGQVDASADDCFTEISHRHVTLFYRLGDPQPPPAQRNGRVVVEQYTFPGATLSKKSGYDVVP